MNCLEQAVQIDRHRNAFVSEDCVVDIEGIVPNRDIEYQREELALVRETCALEKKRVGKSGQKRRRAEW